MVDFNKYEEMRKEAEKIENAIRYYYQKRPQYTVYCVYVANDFSHTDDFFIDIEIGGNADLYKHYRGYYSRHDIYKAWNIK